MAELPEYLTDQTFEAILQRMLNALPPDISKAEGDYIWDALSPAAIELALAAIWVQEVLRRAFVQTTFGEYLDLRAEEYDVERRPAVAATGSVTFTGTPGTVIPAGTRVATPANENTLSVEFQTLAEVTIGDTGSATADIEALEAGASGNVASNTITLMLESISGITSVTNPEPTTGGLDEEDDESLRARILESAKKDEGDGNVSDYEIWAKEVSGVGNVLVEPLWQGEGTVRVVILDPDGRFAPQSTIDAMQEYLDPGGQGIGEGKAPVGARVTVTTAEVRLIDASILGLVPEAGYTLDQAKTNAKEALANYLKKISPSGTIRIKGAEAEIINAPGVLDMGELLLDGARDNITLEVTELADLGSVSYE